MINDIKRKALFFIFFVLLNTPVIAALTEAEIASYQKEIANRPLGERIALWAERFIGVPYDPDPLGEYVTKGVIVNDERVDCMYLSFRALELALSTTPEEAIEIALDKRFITKGILKGGRILNYSERFRYGEDMLDSGKWGEDITSMFGKISYIKGARGRDQVAVVSKEEMIRTLSEGIVSLRNGDFIYFVKLPEKRVADEIVGHIGIIKIEGNEVFIIHAHGIKNRGGIVKKVSLLDYLKSMPFAGARVGRFTDP